MVQHPPTPGPFVQPNFLAIMDALEVPFPISKRELLEQVEEDTVVLGGRNVALHDLIKDIHDDYFESEGEFLAALETHYSTISDGEVRDIMIEDEPTLEGNPRSIEDGLEEAARDRTGEHLHDDTPDEKGKPEAVNLERDEPITTAARRRDSF